MKIHENLRGTARLLEILAVPRHQALTIRQIAEQFFNKRGAGHGSESNLSEGEIRKVQRYMQALAEPGAGQPALVERYRGGGDGSTLADQKQYRYYQKTSSLNKWLLSENAALDLILAQQILGRSFSSALSGRDQAHPANPGNSTLFMAEEVASQDVETQRLRSCLRVVPDWIGRVPAKIEKDILKEVVNAIAKDRKLVFEYRTVAKKSKSYMVSPRGLVAKDWTIYLLYTTGLSDQPGPALALHRMQSASCSHEPRDQRTEAFDLDAFIDQTHQLSHLVSDKPITIDLSLRVAPETIYHFYERPLSKNQDIVKSIDEGGWYTVHATILETILLVPFLLSMGGWIEVLGPQRIRDEVATRIRKMAGHY